jgi:hypothetical protein
VLDNFYKHDFKITVGEVRDESDTRVFVMKHEKFLKKKMCLFDLHKAQYFVTHRNLMHSLLSMLYFYIAKYLLLIFFLIRFKCLSDSGTS